MIWAPAIKGSTSLSICLYIKFSKWKQDRDLHKHLVNTSSIFPQPYLLIYSSYLLNVAQCVWSSICLPDTFFWMKQMILKQWLVGHLYSFNQIDFTFFLFHLSPLPLPYPMSSTWKRANMQFLFLCPASMQFSFLCSSWECCTPGSDLLMKWWSFWWI